MMTRRFTVLVLLFGIAVPGLQADEPVPPEPSPSLQEIMQQLNADTLALATALMNEDWAAIAQAGKAIADHPKAPPDERRRIVGHLGERAGQFVAYDKVVHDAAQAIAAAAAERDLDALNRQFGRMIEGCTGCHADFRAEVRDLRVASETGR